jgi:hypothetical protein
MGSGYRPPAAKRVVTKAQQIGGYMGKKRGGDRATKTEDGGGQDQRQGRTLIVVRVVCGGDDDGRGFSAAPQGLERWKQLVAAKRVVVAPAVASVSMAGAGICCRAGCGGWAKGQRKRVP